MQDHTCGEEERWVAAAILGDPVTFAKRQTGFLVVLAGLVISARLLVRVQLEDTLGGVSGNAFQRHADQRTRWYHRTTIGPDTGPVYYHHDATDLLYITIGYWILDIELLELMISEIQFLTFHRKILSFVDPIWVDPVKSGLEGTGTVKFFEGDISITAIRRRYIDFAVYDKSLSISHG